MEIKLSLCIPTYNRFNYLIKYIPSYLCNKYIDEIVINDEDGEDYELLNLYFGGNDKIKLFKNDKKLGPFLNKERVVSLCKNDWICLMDSDNYAPIEYFEAFYKYINQNGLNNKYIYSPSKTLPEGNFDFRFMLNHKVNFKNIKEFWSIHNFGAFINLGNYIFHKKEYLENLNNKEFEFEDIADVKYKNYFLLKQGCILVAIPGMEYYHSRDNSSYYLKVHNNDGFKEIDKKIDNLFLSSSPNGEI